jgi:hypothetical protein
MKQDKLEPGLPVVDDVCGSTWDGIRKLNDVLFMLNAEIEALKEEVLTLRSLLESKKAYTKVNKPLVIRRVQTE